MNKNPLSQNKKKKLKQPLYPWKISKGYEHMMHRLRTPALKSSNI